MKISKEEMMYVKDHIENDTLFIELHNTKGEVIRIFPLKGYKRGNDYITPSRD